MARLVLRSGFSLKQLGYAILDAAAANADGDASRTAGIETAIRGMFDLTSNPGTIVFHYDSSETVHIAIPDLEGKRIRRMTADLEEFEIADIAAECMGSIVIRGCTK